MLLGLLNYGPTEQALTHFVAKELSNKIGSEVSIGNIEIGLFNRLMLEDVCIKDRQKQTMLKAQTITAKIELKSLFKDQLALRTVSLLDANLNLYKQKKDSATNFQFVIDAFASKEKKKKSELDLRINSIILRRTNVAYNECFKPYKLGKLDFSHLAVKNINANISLKRITPQNIHLRIRSLSFNEQSGFCINKLRFDVQANRQKAILRNFILDMPHSHVALKKVEASYHIQKGLSDIWPTLCLNTKLRKWRISTSDFRALVDIPTYMDFTLLLSSDVKISDKSIDFKDLSINEIKNKFKLKSQVNLYKSGATISAIKLQFQQLYIQNEFAKQLANGLKLKEQQLQMLAHLGNINAKGNVLYSTAKDALYDAELKSDIGTINAKGKWYRKQLQVQLIAKDVQPNLLLNNDKLPSHINLSALVSADLANSHNPIAKVDAKLQSLEWNKYKYQQISALIKYNAGHISATINSSDPNLKFAINAQSALNKDKKVNAIKLRGNVFNFCPAALGLSTPYGQALFSGNLDVNLSNLSSALPLGSISIKDFNMQNSSHGNYSLNDLHVSLSQANAQHQDLSINSDFMDANIVGELSVNKLKNAAFTILNRCLPGLVSQAHNNYSSNDNWHIKAMLKRTDFLNKMLGLNVSMLGGLSVNGVINANENGHTSVTLFNTNQINIDGNEFNNPSIYLSGSGNNYQCIIKTNKDISGKNYNISANLSTDAGKLTTKIKWNGATEVNYNGSLESVTQFYTSNKGVNFKMHIRPTQVALADTIWNIASGNISHIDNNIAIAGVELSHSNQALRIDGEIAPGQNDSIVANLRNIDIDYILDLVNFDAVAFGGQASGQMVFTQRNHEPQLHANLHVPDFTFNNGQMGDADIHGSWNKSENRINLKADMKLPNTLNYGTKLTGYVSLAEKGLDLHIQTNHTRLQFLRRYIDDLFGNFDGDATGYVRLFGPFKKLDFEGEVKANCRAKVLSTGVDYKLTNGNVKFAPGEFVFSDFNISDGRKGKGKASGVLQHTHLKNLRYDFDVSADEMLCYNQPKQNDMPFYSTTTGTGTVHLNGRPKHFTADINLRTDAPTTFVYDLGTQTSFSKDDRMIRFHAKNNKTKSIFNPLMTDTLAQPYIYIPAFQKNNDEYGTDITLNFLLNVNSSAQIRIITDPRSGDALTAYGNGTLRATWHNKGSFEMFGTYSVSHGDYKISLQDIIRKNLVIQPNSTITFGGNPLDALLALKTVYTVNGVSLNDLNYGAGFSNKTVRADCILNIGGLAQAPKVSFDLDLHNISEDEKQMVRQLISTDEDMSKQVMCLLGVGRFLTTASATTSAGTDEVNTSQQSAAAMRSFLSTTLSSQLNSVISSALGSQSKWSFGTNFMPGTEGWNDMEVDGLLQGRLFNDRLLINGNFGYRDNSTYTSNFVGDFDIRYLLTPRGSVSLRAYSETNDRYFTKSSLTTQGVGISLQRDFTRLKDLFRIIYRNKKKNK